MVPTDFNEYLIDNDWCDGQSYRRLSWHVIYDFYKVSVNM